MSRRLTLPFTIASTVWLTVVWVLLWGSFDPGTILAGLVLALVVAGVFHLPPVRVDGRVHPVSMLFLLWRFLVDLVVASAQVVLLALDPRRQPRSAVIGVQLRSRNELYMTLTSQITCLVPGSVVVEAHRTTGMLYVHVLDLGIAHGVEAARQHVLDTEARVLRALASDAELADAQLPRNPKGKVPERPEVTA